MTDKEAREFGLSLLQGIADRNNGKYAENVKLAISVLSTNDDIKNEWWNKGYLQGRKQSRIPAKELGLPKEYDIFD